MPDTRVSFEYFPPASPLATRQLQNTVEKLDRFNPRFVSMTYGAGGGQADRSLAAVDTLKTKGRAPVLGHITMVDQTQAEISKALDAYENAGVAGYVALRGDAKSGADTQYAYPTVPAFIEDIKARSDAPVYVAAYPTPHPKAASQHADIYALKQKIDAGADAAISQFFFEAEDFLRFRDQCAAAGIERPIIPGILPFTSADQVTRLSKLSGLEIPAWLVSGLRNAQTHKVTEQFALAVATEMIEALIAGGVEDIHFYALNSAKVVEDVCTLFGFGQSDQTGLSERRTA